jgi:hypothetical protein
MATFKSTAFALCASSILSVTSIAGLGQAFAQDSRDATDDFSDGVKLGRSLNDPRLCSGSGDYHQGCVDGVQESQFDREADQALDSQLTDTTRPEANAPVLSPPAGMFQEPFSKPGDPTPPNN